jgi:1-acyl-sn-glycerol-3-phosphate acyltransferase
MFAELKAIARIFAPPPDPDAVIEPDRDLARVAAVLLGIVRRYFRGKVIGIDRLPEGSALIVGNHNAGITDMEPLLLGLAWYHRTGGQDFLRFLGHDLMTSMPVVGSFLGRLGMIRASHDAAERALRAGKKVMVYPGGNYEAFRPFSQRHWVDFGGKVGYIKLALRAQVPIVPTLSLGGHETLFVISRGQTLARWTGIKRYLRSDSFPLFFGLPWGLGIGPIFHLPLPSKLLVEIGEPMLLDGYGPEHAEDPQVLRQLSAEVQARIQRMMDHRAAQRRFPILG